MSVRHWPQIPIVANKPGVWQASHGISTALLLSSKLLLRYTVLLVTASTQYQNRPDWDIKVFTNPFSLLILLFTHSVENSCFKNLNFIINCCDQLFPQVSLSSSVWGRQLYFYICLLISIKTGIENFCSFPHFSKMKL